MSLLPLKGSRTIVRFQMELAGNGFRMKENVEQPLGDQGKTFYRRNLRLCYDRSPAGHRAVHLVTAVHRLLHLITVPRTLRVSSPYSAYRKGALRHSHPSTNIHTSLPNRNSAGKPFPGSINVLIRASQVEERRLLPTILAAMLDKIFRLVTVNTAPERAKRLIGRVVEDVKDKYTIVYVANVEKIADVKATVEREQPNLLFTASMWTPEQAQEIVGIAKATIPGIKTFSLPQGLQVQKGPDAVVEYIKENLPGLLDSYQPTIRTFSTKL